MDYLRKRFGEASTYAGIGLVIGAASLAFPQYAAIMQAIAGALGVPAFLIPDAANRGR